MRLGMRRERATKRERETLSFAPKKRRRTFHQSESDFFPLVVFLNASKTGERSAFFVCYETKEDKEYEARDTHNATVFCDEE